MQCLYRVSTNKFYDFIFDAWLFINGIVMVMMNSGHITSVHLRSNKHVPIAHSPS